MIKNSNSRLCYLMIYLDIVKPSVLCMGCPPTSTGLESQFNFHVKTYKKFLLHTIKMIYIGG